MSDHLQSLALISGAIGAACNSLPNPSFKIAAGGIWILSNIALGSMAYNRREKKIVALYSFYCCTSLILISTNL